MVSVVSGLVRLPVTVPTASRGSRLWKSYLGSMNLR